ncbi:MAG: pyrroline-5-carboxylate reductase [Candidatus Omnitrophica bacterium]|nr:pyrroline-5-carboxylate reductase [Candidatus Omnitrophota bacterium]
MKRPIGIIGFGNMGKAIAERIKSRYMVSVFDKDKTKTKNLKRINVADNIAELVNGVNTIILAVKPQDFENVLDSIKDCVNDRLIISIAAGIPINYIARRLRKAKVIRVMPNLAVKIGKGMNYLSKGKFTSKSDLFFAKRIFGLTGKTMVIKENMMNAATAVSGSGPGFLFALLEKRPKKEWLKYCNEYFIPELRKAALDAGFSRGQARLVSVATAKGSLELLKRTYCPPAVLCARVASRGGTTEAGLKVLYKKGLNAAVRAALRRAKELSKRG